MEYPRHLFRHPGGYGEGKWSYKLAGAADEAEEAVLLADGWHLTKEAAWGLEEPKPAKEAAVPDADPPEKTLLDGNADEVMAALPGLSLEDLEALKVAETEGKTRKGVLAAIDAAIDEALAKDGNGD